MLRVLKWGFAVILVSILILISGLSGYFYYIARTLPENHGNVQAELYLGEGDNQPLIVGLGGSEGGNAWTDSYWQAQRNTFLEQGYAFLAIGYFGMEGVPEKLDRIALEGVHQAVLDAAANPRVNEHCIAVMGGSKGGELALALGSYYPDYKAVVGIVPSHVIFVGLTDALITSSFSLDGEPLPFVPMPWAAIPDYATGNFRSAFETMLENETAVAEAAIPVENINGSVFLISGTEDEMWPSSEMSDLVVERLQTHNFPYHYEHIAINGGHSAPLDHFEQIEVFLSQYFLSENDTNCVR